MGAGLASTFDVMNVDRTGRARRLVDDEWRGSFNSLALAPDGQRIAIGQGLAAGSLNIWLKDLNRGPNTRLTLTGQDRRPAWSPDGREVAFIRDTVGNSSVYAVAADGSGRVRRLVSLDRSLQEVAWSRDWIVVRTDNGADGAGDLIGIRTAGDTTPVPLASSPAEEVHPAISPDGRWLAYTSSESGRGEVFVRSLDLSSTSRWQVSTAGGDLPRWSPDGRELYYVVGGLQLTAATVRTTPSFRVEGRQQLFSVAQYFLDPYHQAYDVRPDGSGFVFLRPLADSASSSGAIQLVRAENWFSDLAARKK
jgi:Tol biopolymer transport system component